MCNPITCTVCSEEVCPHGLCRCEGDGCYECWKRKEAEAEADREVAYQRDVIGPLMGWEEP